MSTYRHGKYTERYAGGITFYSIDKKTLFGWKELQWWHDTPEGKKSMKKSVKHLRQLGHTVL
jgi:hypothetical protein